MKSLPMILVVLLAGGAGAASGWIASRCAQCHAPAGSSEPLAVDIQSQASVPAKPATREAELAAKVESLERALDAMHQDVAELRSNSTRTPAVEPEAAPIETDAHVFAAQHKSAILAVIEEDRAEQARKTEEERKQREQQQAQRQAERTAQRVGLNPAQTKQLEGFYEVQRAHMEEMRAGMQNGGDPQGLRTAFQDFRTWNETELTKLYGSEIAGKIMEEGGGFGMGRGQAAFGGGPGGPGGNAQGGGGRRGRNGGAGQAPAAPGGSGQTDNGGAGGG